MLLKKLLKLHQLLLKLLHQPLLTSFSDLKYSEALLLSEFGKARSKEWAFFIPRVGVNNDYAYLIGRRR